jgi:hypothetical protein
MFRDYVSVPSSGVENVEFLILGFLPLKMGRLGRPEMAVRNGHYRLLIAQKFAAHTPSLS